MDEVGIYDISIRELSKKVRERGWGEFIFYK